MWGEVVRDYYERLIGDVEGAAKRLRIDMTAAAIDGATDVDRALERLRARGADALYVAASPFMVEHGRRIVQLAAQQRVPAIYESAAYVEDGGLMSYGPNIPANYRRAARYVDRMLKGAKPGDLPVE